MFDFYEPVASVPYAYRDWYSQIFALCSLGPDITLVNVSLPGASGILAELGAASRYDWRLSMNFFKFDGDTLVGNLWGRLSATRR